ncbi:hypothetical protein HD73_2755 [Bacillus thuringiensis serovar kurstaki str. HD73]|nr:hypothetical protein HD73_2755 [Bacillus thuringiensis serovar kurstaki str. HD73]KLA13235.1 hypothetical protein B4158_3174 [Bacillus cereus]
MFNEKWVYSVKDFGVIQIHFLFYIQGFHKRRITKMNDMEKS